MIENENALGNKNRRLLEHWVLVYIILDFQIWFLNPKIFRSEMVRFSRHVLNL